VSPLRGGKALYSVSKEIRSLTESCLAKQDILKGYASFAYLLLFLILLFANLRSDRGICDRSE
jgi:hypothetical protein